MLPICQKTLTDRTRSSYCANMYSRGSLEHETSRSSSTTQKKEQISGAPHPDLELPAPSYSYDFQMSVDLNPKVAVGAVPSGGVRNWISFSGGNWAAKWGSGTVLVSRPPLARISLEERV